MSQKVAGRRITMKKSLLIKTINEEANDLFNGLAILGYEEKNERKDGILPFVLTVDLDNRSIRYLYFDASCNENMIAAIEKNCVSINEILCDFGFATTVSTAEPISEPKVEQVEQTAEPIAEPKVEQVEQTAEPISEPKVEQVEQTAEPISEPKVEQVEQTAEPIAEPKVEQVEQTAEPISEPTIVDVALKLYNESEKVFSGVDKADKCKIIGEIITRCVLKPELIKMILQEHKNLNRMWKYIIDKVQEKAKNQQSLFSSDYIVYDWAEEYFMLDDKAKIEEEERIEAERKAKAEEEAKIKAEKEAKKKERAAKKAEREAKKKAKEEAEKKAAEEKEAPEKESDNIPVAEVVTSTEIVTDETGIIEEVVSPDISSENIAVENVEENNQTVDLESEKVANELASISESENITVEIKPVEVDDFFGKISFAL